MSLLGRPQKRLHLGAGNLCNNKVVLGNSEDTRTDQA